MRGVTEGNKCLTELVSAEYILVPHLEVELGPALQAFGC